MYRFSHFHGKRNCQSFRLHPSISEVQMRRSCLKALSSIISWPTRFGNMPISSKFLDNELKLVKQCFSNFIFFLFHFFLIMLCSFYIDLNLTMESDSLLYNVKYLFDCLGYSILKLDRLACNVLFFSKSITE